MRRYGKYGIVDKGLEISHIEEKGMYASGLYKFKRLFQYLSDDD